MQPHSIFEKDSTVGLCKKLMIYKVMSSNIFINHALQGMNLAYKVMGKTITNTLINMTAGQLFTSGETLQTLSEDIKELEKRNIGGIG
jgi:hypothetical protein